MARTETSPSPEELIAERSKPGELTALHRRLQRTGGCRAPIRLLGTSRDGGYTTRHEPDGVLLVACGSRLASRCPSCAATYRGDARQVVLAGMAGGKGVPETVADHPAVFFTLTAPSFGAVHSGRAGRCHLGPPGDCRHGRPRHCLSCHDDGDEVVGSPICVDCFDYEACVAFNATAGELWRRVSVYTYRQLAYATGTTEATLRSRVRLSFVKASEFQRRGAVHLHGLLRADAAGDELAPAAAITPALLADALVRAVAAARIRKQVGGRELVLAFGSQLKVDPVDPAGGGRIGSYMSKYAVKQVESSGLLDRRIREDELDHLQLPEHLRRLVATAFALARAGHPRCRRAAHQLGWSGHVLTKSRRWSTTFACLRRARRDWRVAESGERPLPGTTSWRFDGVGLRCEIDRMLALGIAEQRRQARIEAAFARMEQRAAERQAPTWCRGCSTPPPSPSTSGSPSGTSAASSASVASPSSRWGVSCASIRRPSAPGSTLDRSTPGGDTPARYPDDSSRVLSGRHLATPTGRHR